MDTLDHTGKKIWGHCGTGTIFISPDLKTEFDQSGIMGLETDEGFSMFG